MHRSPFTASCSFLARHFYQFSIIDRCEEPSVDELRSKTLIAPEALEAAAVHSVRLQKSDEGANTAELRRCIAAPGA